MLLWVNPKIQSFAVGFNELCSSLIALHLPHFQYTAWGERDGQEKQIQWMVFTKFLSFFLSVQPRGFGRKREETEHWICPKHLTEEECSLVLWDWGNLLREKNKSHNSFMEFSGKIGELGRESYPALICSECRFLHGISLWINAFLSYFTNLVSPSWKTRSVKSKYKTKLL